MAMFDVFAYAVAVLAVLWFVADRPAAGQVDTVEAEVPVARPVPAVAAVMAPARSVRVEVPVAEAEVTEAADDLLSLAELLAEAEFLAAKPAPQVKQYAAMNCEALRRECAAKEIAWRNAHGKGKHLKKGEMLVALG